MNKNHVIKGILILITAVAVYSCFPELEENNSMKQTYAEEMARLDAYLDSLTADGYDVDTTEMGVYYVTIQAGTGAFPVPGDTLEVQYNGYLMNGYRFDSSELTQADGTWDFVLGNPPMIEGWDDGMTVINKGANVQLIIPSPLAYGPEGNGQVIPPNNTLLFVVKMKNIK